MPLDVLFVAVGIVVVIFLILITIASMWKKVPQDKAIVVTGLRKRVITGGGGMVIPIFERTDVISLENMKIEVRIDGALTEQGVEIFVDGVSVVKVRSDEKSILQSMEQFNTGKGATTIEAIRNTVRDVLEGKLREIISKLTVEEIYKDREKFAAEVESTASVALAEMGLEIKVFTIRDISDKNQYLESLGKKQIAQVKKDAIIAEAEANKESAIKQAEANRLAKEAELLAQTQISEAEKEKSLKVEAFRRDSESARATADNAYQIQTNRVKKEVAETEIQVEISRREREIELAEKEAIRTERELEATVIKKADADLYLSQKQAEANKFNEVKKAEAKSEQMRLEGEALKFSNVKQAEAAAEQIKLEGEARAQAIIASGKAEAESMTAKGLAQVEIIRETGKAEAEAMMKKAEAYKQYNEAAILQMVVEKMPEIAANVAAPLAKTEKIVMIGDGGSKLTRSVVDIMAQVPELTQTLTGIDLKKIIESVTHTSPVTPMSQDVIKVDEDHKA